MKVAINGFGRIGRVILRAALANNTFGEKFELVAINDPGGAQTAAQLLKYDSVHGKLKAELTHGKDWISINGMKIPVVSEREPLKLPWGEMGVDTALECTGIFRDREGASKHLEAGAKKVLVSAPCKAGGADITVVIGVNEKEYKKGNHKIISMASCTTNCLAPVAKVVNDNFGIKQGFMTTVHAYTNDQNMLDVYHKDPRRARAGAINIIPTTTGAAKALGEVIPELKGKLDGSALRVPVACGSATDMVFELQKEAKAEDVNAAIKKEANGKMKGILQYCDEPIVSSDVIGNSHSSVFDSLSSMSIGKSVKLLSWYDNEWGYSNRMVDMVTKVL
ncbi:type I glyceraldehyde-3-phosphate dehydrogenase [Candidatus Micrarchaeota archaeon CG10_big_fil_rev_8_21_14_0_10_45_29]|nr:MAG: type I glyceraldehyde-3-phosphate dehydrogenase [Candidatus Micrarchaeota archaeon CG10_big_fil_rev_8_21_14_0_10_45_29]